MLCIKGQQREKQCDEAPTDVAVDDVHLIVPHQANERIISAAVKRLGVDPGRVMLNIAEHGNTAAASVPMALSDAVNAGRVEPGDTPHELYAYADRLWQDQPYAQFFKGSPLLEVLDFLERLELLCDLSQDLELDEAGTGTLSVPGRMPVMSRPPLPGPGTPWRSSMCRPRSASPG